MTVHQIKITRPDEEETGYFWKLFHAASRNDNRWGGWNVQDIAEELKRTDLDRKQKLFLLRAWQVLVDDQGGFGRFMSAFDTYVLNMQDPEQDVVAWKPEIIRMSEDAELLPVVLEAYEEALLETRRPLPIGELKARLEEQTGERWDYSADMQRQQADLVMLVKVLCRSLKKYNHNSDLAKRATDYLSREGLISASDCLRGGDDDLSASSVGGEL